MIKKHKTNNKGLEGVEGRDQEFGKQTKITLGG
jgi:hypothetical protein